MNYKVSWLDYSKQILEKVSFDTMLFVKELNKAVKLISDEDIVAFERWVYNTFMGELNAESIRLIDLHRNKSTF